MKTVCRWSSTCRHWNPRTITHTHIYKSFCVCVCVYVYTYLFTYMCVYVCAYVHKKHPRTRTQATQKPRSARTPGAQTTAQKDVNKHHATEGFGGGWMTRHSWYMPYLQAYLFFNKELYTSWLDSRAKRFGCSFCFYGSRRYYHCGALGCCPRGCCCRFLCRCFCCYLPCWFCSCVFCYYHYCCSFVVVFVAFTVSVVIIILLLLSFIMIIIVIMFLC